MINGVGAMIVADLDMDALPAAPGASFGIWALAAGYVPCHVGGWHCAVDAQGVASFEIPGGKSRTSNIDHVLAEVFLHGTQNFRQIPSVVYACLAPMQDSHNGAELGRVTSLYRRFMAERDELAKSMTEIRKITEVSSGMVAR